MIITIAQSYSILYIFKMQQDMHDSIWFHKYLSQDVAVN